MFGLSIGKLLVVALVIVAVWRGLRILEGISRSVGKEQRAPRRRQQPRQQTASGPPTTELVECPRCGVFVPNGTICPSKEQCRYRREA